MANHELIELDYDPLEFLDGEGLTSAVSQEGVAEVAETGTTEEQMATTLELHEALGGCFNIVGPIALCYNKVGAGFKVCLKLAGIEAACANIGLNKCQMLQANILLAKASIEVCLKGKCLTYKAQACYRTTPFSKWKCVSKSGTIICL
ncbi:MAG: hypothetical protein HC849_04250 [Oscillatoriales cyanobacterium RU_3_3]|nr:hypothetical protein [Microcoleus sp. SU_5_6]NJL66603.1 hypothetical protein [Microcoleus sp. SM1_3_4]NJM59580.1 hypothetical protein [Oscillatoriales cyanobacterium RU_3_3]NJR23409.1 hypothetical protein [Richelia sp. CSU_2_1]